MTEALLNRELEKSRNDIESFFEDFFRSQAPGLAAVNSWGADFIKRIRPFATGGKMIRGCLVRLALDGYGAVPGRGIGPRAARRDAVKAGAALELFHSAFLIHDDIMDDDPFRRGKPSLHVQYAAMAGRKGHPDAAGFGRAAALCAGDVLIFLGLEILASLESPAPVKTRILGLFGRELAAVGPAQVQDVYSGKVSRASSREEIFRLYTYKTARYTYFLPLAAGALLAGAGPAALRDLERIGVDLGLVFQVKDDELGQFGDPAATGKPVGSDIGEGKKTLYYLYLCQALGPKAAALYGKKRPTAREIHRLNSLIRRLGIPETIEQDLGRIAGRCAQRIRRASLPAGFKDALKALLETSLKRTF
ncbi:MAG: polyprenyl synthetase family protein [Candidatus Aminicenantes bacterium]|nr:polyprenyl synthetase family protein [Candidatus Aminicenantes bacterium]